MISPDAATAGFRFNSPSSGQFGYAQIISGGYTAGDLTIGTNQLNGYLAFKTGNSVERMRVSPTGNVGIGATELLAKLEILFTNGAKS